ncbi:glycosyltransferase [Hydrocarboniphaga effusa]|uniref:glycosyltransferase n=5 Tax=Hydrocarboniphaga effusa TaxID=243629 RepID=UPI003BA9AA7C
MRVAIIHYWFTTWRGGERVFEELLRLFPDADVYAHVADQKLIDSRVPGLQVRETWIAKLPLGRKLFRLYLPLMPMALESLDLQAYDLIISSESGPTKGVIKRPDALHICYCHSPMRYIWDMSAQYRRNAGLLKGLFLSLISTWMRVWDVTTSMRVDAFIANSLFVSRRISSYYGRGSTVIHPPVRMQSVRGLSQRDRSARNGPGEEPYYVVASELVAYKRVELAIEAAQQLGRKLVVVGEGEQFKALKAMAGPNVHFAGRVSDDEFAGWLANARALLFPGLEDFGIVPVEAMANGTPVIAYARGGALEYLMDGVNGVGFSTQSVDALAAAIKRFESIESKLRPEAVRASVLRFGPERFQQQFLQVLDSLLDQRADLPRPSAAPSHPRVFPISAVLRDADIERLPRPVLSSVP